MFLRKAFQVLFLAALTLLWIGGAGLAQDRPFGPTPFGDKHVGGDVPIDERLASGARRSPRRLPVEDRVITKGPLAPSKADRTAFAAFLRPPDTGLIRLRPIEKVSYRPAPTGIPASGAHYSFANLTHLLMDGSDIGLGFGNLSVGSVRGYGFLTNLGDVPLERVALSDPRASFAAAYQPAVNLIAARAETLRFRQGVIIDGTSCRGSLPVDVNSTYLVRSINYGKPVFSPYSSRRSSDNARGTDVLVAFTVVRRDTDESLVIAWKLLKKYSEPKLD